MSNPVTDGLVTIPSAPSVPSIPVAPAETFVDAGAQANTNSAAPVEDKPKKKGVPVGETALREYYERAKVASAVGGIREFARAEGSQLHLVQSVLYRCAELGLPMLQWKAEPVVEKSRSRKKPLPTSVEIYLYTGRAKTPYLSTKPIPAHLLGALGAEAGDQIDFTVVDGKLIGTLVKAQPAVPVAA